jgi:hypothetical protein
MDSRPEVGEVYNAYEAVRSDYHRKVESMLALARDPGSNAEQFRTASMEVARAAERLQHLRVLIKASFDSGLPDQRPSRDSNGPLAA